MNAKTISVVLTVILALSGIQPCPAQTNAEDVRILSSTETECTIEFSLTGFRLDTVTAEGKIYHRVRFDRDSPMGDPGDPQIPCRLLTFGVPADANPRLVVLGSNTTTLADVRLIPTPSLEKEDGLPKELFTEGAGYARSGFLPESPADLGKPEQWGEYPVVTVLVRPIRYDPVSKTLLVLRNLTFRLQFNGSRVSAPIPSTKKDPLLKGLVNAEKAGLFRIPPSGMRIRKSTLAGERYKMPITQQGIFKITGTWLEGKGIDISSIDPTTLKIYDNGGRELPRDVQTAAPDSLIENPILVVGAEDNQFDGSDYLLFYAPGVTGWDYNSQQKTFRHYINRYATQNTAWLVFNDGKPGKRIPLAASLSGNGTPPVTALWDRTFLEQDIQNILKGGVAWYGTTFDLDRTSETYDISLYDPLPDDSVRLTFLFVGGTSSSHRFTIGWNDAIVKVFSFSGTGSVQAQALSLEGVRNGQNSVSLAYTASGSAPRAYLDWFEVEYRRSLLARDNRLRFTSPAAQGISRFVLTGFSAEPFVLRIDGLSDVSRMPLSQNSGTWEFVDSTESDNPKNYTAVSLSAALVPERIEKDERQDLKDPGIRADLLIITPKAFSSQAALLQSHREQHDSLSVFVADIQDVYDEFSGGLFDPTAIRNFVRYAFEHWSLRPSYLLLFGDGHYDYRNILYPSLTNWIPPFEFDGLSESGSRASDDWYTYVAGNDSKMDLAVGRLPASSESEARAVVDKIISYETEPVWGDWRTLITMVADDEKAQTGTENETTHMLATEDMAENIIPRRFNLKKIYLTEYPESITAEGRRKPEARDDLIDRINRGTLLVNWVGHGNEELWAHEWIFERDRDFPLLENHDAFPLFYAATCAFAWYDNPAEASFSELLINAADRGAVAVIAASRFCSAAPNEALNKSFLSRLFSETQTTLRLGDALRLAKLTVSSTANNEMYHVLGDPTMRLGVPEHPVSLVSVQPDTFQALGVVQVKGTVLRNGLPWTEADGKVLLRGYDSKKDVVYETQYGSKVSYKLPGSALFRGEASVENGDFTMSFLVPKDITYGGRSARLSVYFSGGETDGTGFRDAIAEEGSIGLVDTEGPTMVLSFAGLDNFVSGDMVGEEPELVARIEDPVSGINITGEIGHAIVLTTDSGEKQDVTELFQYDEGNYLKGSLKTTLSGLSPGSHEVGIKAWDNSNNSSVQSIRFFVVSDDELSLENVLNYPNPLSSSTHFTFTLSRSAEVDIRIYTVDGRLIRRIEGIPGTAGFNMVFWDGRDQENDEPANGVYLFKIAAIARDAGKTVKKDSIGRLMIFR